MPSTAYVACLWCDDIVFKFLHRLVVSYLRDTATLAHSVCLFSSNAFLTLLHSLVCRVAQLHVYMNAAEDQAAAASKQAHRHTHGGMPAPASAVTATAEAPHQQCSAWVGINV